MAINLSKGQSISLDKNKHNLSRMTMGLGWDTRQAEPQGGFFKRLLSSGGDDFDLDGFALLLNADGKLAGDKDVIHFSNLRSSDGSVVHSGDNLTGEGEGDDEVIALNLSQLPERYVRVIFAVNIYNGAKRKQHFGLVANAFVRAIDGDGKEMARYQLSRNSEYDGATSMLMGELVRSAAGWDFRAIGEVAKEDGIAQVAARYR
jgi:stress response protein SCP2